MLVQPIVLYGTSSDVWGAYAHCTKDVDNVFLWHTRCVLNIKATTCNVITIGESGIIPPKIKCHENVILNFIRLNCMPRGPIVKKIFEELMNLHSMGFECWVTRVMELSSMYGIDLMAHDYSDNTKKNIKTIIRGHFVNAWHSDLKNLTKYPILRTYNLFKRKFEREEYLSSVANHKYRTALSKLRSSSHTLEIERGRYTIPITPANKRICHVCIEVEDELHFLLHCRLYTKERNALITKASEILPQFTNYTDLQKFQALLESKHKSILTLVGKFIHNSFNARTMYYNTK